MNETKIFELDEGWNFMEEGITKLTKVLEGHSETQISSEEYMMHCTTIYNMCTQKPPRDYSQQFYEKYKESFDRILLQHLSLPGPAIFERKA